MDPATLAALMQYMQGTQNQGAGVPAYARNNLFGTSGSGGAGGGGMMSGMGMGGLGNGLSNIFQGLFGDSGSPYKDASKQYQKYFGDAKSSQEPFYNSGVNGMHNYENWAQGMKDPSAFINNIMGKYQESPGARYNQQQGMRAAQNMGSATGMTGSTPLMQQAQQNAQNISSQDQDKYLQNVLGVNNQYGNSQGNLMNMGQHSADMMSNLNMLMASLMGDSSYGNRAGQLKDRGNFMDGFFSLF